MTYLFTEHEWDFRTIKKVWNEIKKIGIEDYGLDIYKEQIEMISSEQMIDCYSSHGLPHMYEHWSFGKSFISNADSYKKGRQGLAYEIVINTDPCIVYLMEDNSMLMQTLVLAHAGIGHNSFFKNNYLFKEWTDAEFIVPYLKYAKDYIKHAEGILGIEQVETLLDICHSLQWHGVNKYKRKHVTAEERTYNEKLLTHYKEQDFNDIWRTLPENNNMTSLHKSFKRYYKRLEEIQRAMGHVLPEENILYFIQKHCSNLKPEVREIIKIVSNIAQYFYPQMQTKLMNEGWATFVHHEILTTMEERELITPGSYLEFLHSHAGVTYQPDHDSPHYSGINVYALGFAMFKDLKRACINPTEEDYRFLPDIAGSNDWLSVLKEIAYNFKDESFILQYLSPKVIRDFKLFSVEDRYSNPDYKISNIQSDKDVYTIRKILSDQFNMGLQIPDIEVVSVDSSTNALYLSHREWEGIPLDKDTEERMIYNISVLWGDDCKFYRTQ